MDSVYTFVRDAGPTISAFALIGVTIWYAAQTQSMARSARDSAASSERAAEHAARSAAVSVATAPVDFEVVPVHSFDFTVKGTPFKGVRLACSGAAVYVHQVTLVEAWAFDPEEPRTPDDYTTIAFVDQPSAPLTGLGSDPLLLHARESVFLDLPIDDWQEVEVASLVVSVAYSFDGKPPLRHREIEWESSETE